MRATCRRRRRRGGAGSAVLTQKIKKEDDRDRNLSRWRPIMTFTIQKNPATDRYEVTDSRGNVVGRVKSYRLACDLINALAPIELDRGKELETYTDAVGGLPGRLLNAVMAMTPEELKAEFGSRTGDGLMSSPSRMLVVKGG
jgi:hypothetical protein